MALWRLSSSSTLLKQKAICIKNDCKGSNARKHNICMLIRVNYGRLCSKYCRDASVKTAVSITRWSSSSHADTMHSRILPMPTSLVQCWLVDLFLHHWPHCIVHWTQVWIIRWPECGRNKVWCLDFQLFDCFTSPMCRRTVLLKNYITLTQ